MKYIDKKKLAIAAMVLLAGVVLLWESITFLIRHMPGKTESMRWLLRSEKAAAEQYVPMLTLLADEKDGTDRPAHQWNVQTAIVPWLMEMYEEGWERRRETQENEAYRQLILEDDSTDYYAFMQQENEKDTAGKADENRAGEPQAKEDEGSAERDGQAGSRENGGTRPDDAGKADVKRREEPVYEYDIAQLQEYESLVKSFYVIDQNTYADPEDLDVRTFLQKAYHAEKYTDDPTILIYHTHSQEAFADSAAGDAAATVVGAGERLAACLQEYGYHVLHDTTSFDSESRDYAYSEALPYIEKLLKEYPSIQVVIDLHRDEMREDTHLVTNIDGKECARYMFFNGMSRLRKSGKIEYLENPFLQDNLAFSFQLQKASNEYYPGLSRKIYLKAYRYNLHLRPASVLIELGAQNNTVEEIMNACVPLAQVLDLVLSPAAGE